MGDLFFPSTDSDIAVGRFILFDSQPQQIAIKAFVRNWKSDHCRAGKAIEVTVRSQFNYGDFGPETTVLISNRYFCRICNGGEGAGIPEVSKFIRRLRSQGYQVFLARVCQDRVYLPADNQKIKELFLRVKKLS